MKRIITYFIQYPVTGDVLLVLLLLFGTLSLFNLRSSFFPETPSRAITIQVVFPGAGPEEVEEGVVLKIEDELRGTSGVERVTSVSQENSGSITVEVQRGNDIDVVLQDVKNAVDRIPSFPAGMEPLIVFKIESTTLAMSFALYANTNLKALKEAARRVERDLLGVEGISKVTLSGFPDEEIVINLEEEALQAYQLSFAQVMSAVQNANLELTGGAVKGDEEEYLIRYDGKGYYAEAFQDIVIKTTADGRLVRLQDIARLEDAWAENPARNQYNGTAAVTVDVYNTNDEDILFITDTVRQYVAHFQEANQTIQASIITDSSVTLQQRIDTLKSNGAQGVFLVLVLLALFLHLRLALWVALSIPIAFAGMFILAGFFGITINVISLFGMILVIGILVDDGIVISENIYRHFEEGKPRMRAAIDGTMEVLPAVFSAIITTIVAFSSFFFIAGRLGDFFGEMAFIVIATLIFSLVEGALILPAHVAHSKALDREHKTNKVLQATNRFMLWLRDRLYVPVLDFFLSNRVLAVSIAVALLMISFGAVGGGLVKTTFFPFIERTEVNVGLTMPSGTRERITQGWLDHIEAATWEANEKLKSQRDDGKDVVFAIDKRLGTGGSHTGSLTILLSDMEERKPYDQGVLAVTQAIREATGPIPSAEQVTFGAQSAFGKPVSVGIRGNDMDAVRAAAEELKRELNDLAELKDITDNDQVGQREIRLTLKDKAFLLGLTPGDILLQVRSGFFGGEVQRLQRGLDEVKVWVRYGAEGRNNVDQLGDMRIRTNDGREFPLSELADFELSRGVLAINHTDGQREILVEADIASAATSVTDMIAAIGRDIMPPILARHPGVRYGFEGQVREQAKSTDSMQTVMPVVLILMLSIIVLTFRSFSQTFAVLILIPFALIGVIWGHFLQGGIQISLFSILGIIALIGILVNDSLVFVSTFNNLLKTGKSFREAMLEAGSSRFRPILLTSITTIAGLAPLMLNKSFQAQFLIPMAVSVAYGLLVSTVSILILLPVLLSLFNDMRRFWTWYWNDKRVTPESVEPAVQELSWEPEIAGAIPEEGGRGVDAGVVGVLAAFLLGAGLLLAPLRAEAQTSAATPASPTPATDTLTLERALSEALQANLSLQQAYLNRDVAEMQAHPGMAGLLPSVAANGSYQYGNSNTTLEFADPSVPPIEQNGAASTIANANIGVSYSLQGIQPFKSFERLKAQALASGAQTELVIDNLQAQVVAAYFNVVRSQENLAAVQESTALSRERLERVAAQSKFGTASGLLVLNAEVALNGDSVSLMEAEQVLAEAQYNLNLVLNRPLEQALVVSNQVRFRDDLDLNTLRASLPTSNAELKIATLNERLSMLDWQVARAGFWPTLTLDAGYGYTRSDQDASFILVNENLGFTGTFGLSVPLFTGGTRRVASRSAEIQVRNQQLASEDARRQIDAALLNAWSSLGNARRILSLQSDAVATAADNLARSEEKFLGGTLDGTSFREAQVQWLLARNAQANARFNAKLAEAEVLRLAGAW